MSICSSGDTAVKAAALVAASFCLALFACCDHRLLPRTLVVLLPYGMVPEPISKMISFKIFMVSTSRKIVHGIWQWIQGREETPTHIATLRHSLTSPFWGQRVVILIITIGVFARLPSIGVSVRNSSMCIKPKTNTWRRCSWFILVDTNRSSLQFFIALTVLCS